MGITEADANQNLHFLDVVMPDPTVPHRRSLLIHNFKASRTTAIEKKAMKFPTAACKESDV